MLQALENRHEASPISIDKHRGCRLGCRWTLMTDDKRLTPRAQAATPGPDEAPITVAIEPQPREVVAQILSSLAIAEDVRTL